VSNTRGRAPFFENFGDLVASECILRLSARRSAGIIPGMKKLALSLLCCLALTGGCLEQKLTFTSEPEGALVIVSDKEIGRTPITIDFTWYGDYDVIVRYPEKGYETISDHANISPRWWGYPPMDLFASVMPWKVSDKRYLHYKLKKLQLPNDETLIKRAEQMSDRNARAED
jgi:hypothetical protein